MTCTNANYRSQDKPWKSRQGEHLPNCLEKDAWVVYGLGGTGLVGRAMRDMGRREAINKSLWEIAVGPGNAVPGSEIMQHVTCLIFYRLLSENYLRQVKKRCGFDNYNKLQDSDITYRLRCEIVEALGYFMEPCHLFQSVKQRLPAEEDGWSYLSHVFYEVEASSSGRPSEDSVCGLFFGFRGSVQALDSGLVDKDVYLLALLDAVEGLDLSDFWDMGRDIFGDVYEFFTAKFSAHTRKGSAQFLTPPEVAELVARVALHGQTNASSAYDPSCGSGSLLIQVRKIHEELGGSINFHGQDVDPLMYSMARMNMLARASSWAEFSFCLGDTLTDPQLQERKPFDVVVSNPPYSIKWRDKNDDSFIKDPRFMPAGVLAPFGKGDFAFILHGLDYLSDSGRAVYVCPPGVFYRSGPEKALRKYLVDKNFVEAVISLAPGLFFSTGVATFLLVLSKNKKTGSVKFIEAKDIFTKDSFGNSLSAENIKNIVSLYESVPSDSSVVSLVSAQDIEDYGFDLLPSTYVRCVVKDKKTCLTEINRDLEETLVKNNKRKGFLDTILERLNQCMSLKKY